MRGSTRRAFLATAGASVVRAQLRKPNVLLFLTDQESALLPGPCSLPGRERLWKAGAVEFTHAFCNTPQCSPARSSLLTDEAVSAEAAGWIRGRRGPWLAVVSVLNPHDIYRIPRELKNVAIRAGVRPPATGLANLRGKPAEQRWFADADQGR